ncbi:MAG: hypothetical protein Q9162_002156 [Coniocarpon cinnabarinum]
MNVRPTVVTAGEDNAFEADEGDRVLDEAGDRGQNQYGASSAPDLLHRFQHHASILCLTTSVYKVFAGTQAGEILWLDLASAKSQTSTGPVSHPLLQQDRFFDSPGPGGIRNPQQRPRKQPIIPEGAKLLEIQRSHILQFAHYGYVHCMLLASSLYNFVESSEFLVTAGGDGAACIWALDQAQQGKPLLSARLDDAREDAASIQAVTLEGSLLFTGRADGEINVWDLETRQLVRVWKAFHEETLSLTLASGRLYSTSEHGKVKVNPVAPCRIPPYADTEKLFGPQYECLQSWQAHRGRVLASAFHQHKTRGVFVTGGSDNSVAIWKEYERVLLPGDVEQKEEGKILHKVREILHV